MTWPQLQGHLAALGRHRQRMAEGPKASVDTWADAQHDPFFASHFQRGAGRGR